MCAEVASRPFREQRNSGAHAQAQAPSRATREQPRLFNAARPFSWFGSAALTISCLCHAQTTV